MKLSSLNTGEAASPINLEVCYDIPNDPTPPNNPNPNPIPTPPDPPHPGSI